MKRLSRLLHPLCELEEHLQMMAFQGARTDKLEPGQQILVEDEKIWLTFLLDGELAMGDERRTLETIVAKTPRARRPLFNVFPKGMIATSKTGAVLLRVARRAYLQALHADKHQVVGRGGRLYETIYEAYQKKRLELPVLRDHVIRIRMAIRNPRADVQKISQLVMSDPVISAKLVQVSNSALFPSMKQLTTVRDAVTRIGLKMTDEIVLAQSLKSIFHSRSPVINRRLKETYQHSTLIASLSFCVAREYEQLNKEQAMLAGLLHDLGVIPILTFMEKEDLLDEVTEDEVEHTITHLRGVIGGMVLSNMGFDDGLIAVAEEAESWEREIDGGGDYVDVVNLAHLFSVMGTEEMDLYPRVDEVSAYTRLGFSAFDPDEGLKKVRNAKAIAAAIMSALN